MFHIQIDKIVFFSTKVVFFSAKIVIIYLICKTAKQQRGYMKETNGLWVKKWSVICRFRFLFIYLTRKIPLWERMKATEI